MKTNELWVRRKMGHLLLHLFARDEWKNKIVETVMTRRSLGDKIELPGITDKRYPINWKMDQEANTISFVLGESFEGTWREALEKLRAFVYQGGQDGQRQLPPKSE